MRIFRALKTNLQIQGYGAANTQPSLLSWYQSFGLLFHNGYDWMAKDGEPIYWDCDLEGVVNYISVNINEGYGIVAITDDNVNKFQHRFWHLKSWACKTGDKLKMGQLIGWADNTGASKGTHLHRDLKPLNADLQKELANNGVYGAIDMTPYFVNQFVLDALKIPIIQQMMIIIRQLINMWSQMKADDSILSIIETQAKAAGIFLDSQTYKEGLAVLKTESGFNPHARNVNRHYDKVTGELLYISTDRGLAQINNVAFPNVTDEQADDPIFAANFFWNLFPHSKYTWSSYGTKQYKENLQSL